MKKLILPILLLLSLTGATMAQTKPAAQEIKCTLGVDASPELRGLRLGASQASVLSRFPGTSIEKPDKFGLSQLYLTVMDTSVLPKSMGGRDKAVQPQMSGFSGVPGSEGGFNLDSARFPVLKGV